MSGIGSTPPPSRLSTVTASLLKKVDKDSNGVTAAELLKLDTSHETGWVEFATSGGAWRADGADGKLDETELSKVPEEERAFLRETFAKIKSGEIDPNTVVIDFKATTQQLGQSNYVAPVRRLVMPEGPKTPVKSAEQVSAEIATTMSDSSAHFTGREFALAFIQEKGLKAYQAPPPATGSVYGTSLNAAPLLYENNGSFYKLPGVEISDTAYKAGLHQRSTAYESYQLKDKTLAPQRQIISCEGVEYKAKVGAGVIKASASSEGKGDVEAGIEGIAAVTMATDGKFEITIPPGLHINGDIFAENFGLGTSLSAGPLKISPATGEFELTIDVPTAPISGSITFKGKIDYSAFKPEGLTRLEDALK